MKVSKSVVPDAERHGVKLAVAEDQGLEGQRGGGTLAQGRPAQRDDSSVGTERTCDNRILRYGSGAVYTTRGRDDRP